jgi:parallel beta-helix repeat protein
MTGAFRTALVLAAIMLALGCVRPMFAPTRAAVDLQMLLDRAPDSSRIEIPYGEYVLESGLTLSNRHGLTITARPGTRILVADVMEQIIDLTNSSSIWIENLYLRHVKPLAAYECHGACVNLQNCDRVTIANCELNGCGAFGVAASNCERVMIENCYIHHNTYAGIYLYECDAVTVQNNRIVNNAEVVSQLNVTNLMMSGNRLK